MSTQLAPARRHDAVRVALPRGRQPAAGQRVGGPVRLASEHRLRLHRGLGGAADLAAAAAAGLPGCCSRWRKRARRPCTFAAARHRARGRRARLPTRCRRSCVRRTGGERRGAAARIVAPAAGRGAVLVTGDAEAAAAAAWLERAPASKRQRTHRRRRAERARSGEETRATAPSRSRRERRGQRRIHDDDDDSDNDSNEGDGPSDDQLFAGWRRRR